MNSGWFWLPVLTLNAYLLAIAAIWYRYGWRWALAVAMGGPLLMAVCAVLTLGALFLFGSHAPVCIIEGCGRRATLQIRSKRYLRPLCEPCSRRLAGLQPLPSPGQLFEERLGKPDTWRL